MFLLRDNSSRFQRAYIFTYAMLGCNVLTFFATLWQIYIIDRYESGAADLAELEISDNLMTGSGLLTFACFLAYVVFFIQWFRRAYYNLHQVNPFYPTYREGWAAYAWFTPFINLVRPYQIMKELFVGTRPIMLGQPEAGVSNRAIGFWWMFFIISNLSNNISTRLSLNVEDLAGLASAHYFGLAGDVLGIAGLLLAAHIMLRFSFIERRLAELQHLDEDSIFLPGIPVGHYDDKLQQENT